MDILELQNFGPLRSAKIEFGDLTVLVGPQATGKSIALQTLKLLVDMAHVQEALHRHGFDWEGDVGNFLDLVLGEGMKSIWTPESSIHWQGRVVDLAARARRRTKAPEPGDGERMFFIPAQRVLALRDGWPRPFTDYSAGDPFAVRDFSEKLRLLMETEFSRKATVFPQKNKLRKEFRTLLDRAVFGGFDLKIDKYKSQKRLMLSQEQGGSLPFMVWSAGQREFMPLLLGLYWLLPAGKIQKRPGVEWVVIEELEMGLHPRATSAVLALVMNLLQRGYRVCLSTHSPHVLDVVWAFTRIKKSGSDPDLLLDLFDLPKKPILRSQATEALTRSARVYYFDRELGRAQDISGLDPSSIDVNESGWGWLSGFSGHVSDIVARAEANADAE